MVRDGNLLGADMDTLRRDLARRAAPALAGRRRLIELGGSPDRWTALPWDPTFRVASQTRLRAVVDWLMASATSRCDTSALVGVFGIRLARSEGHPDFRRNGYQNRWTTSESAEGRSGPRGLLRCDRLSAVETTRSAVM